MWFKSFVNSLSKMFMVNPISEPLCPVCKERGKALYVYDWAFGKYEYRVRCANCGIEIKYDFGILLKEIISIIRTFELSKYKVFICSDRLSRAMEEGRKK